MSCMNDVLILTYYIMPNNTSGCNTLTIFHYATASICCLTPSHFVSKSQESGRESLILNY